MQTFIPARFLSGLLPDALISDYMFWQEGDSIMVGYLKREIDQRVMTKTRLRITITKVSVIFPPDMTVFCPAGRRCALVVHAISLRSEKKSACVILIYYIYTLDHVFGLNYQ